MTYFYNKANGLAADVNRHRVEEQELLVKIAALEGKEDDMSKAALRIYSNVLHHLQQSKANAVSKIGRK